MRKDEEMDSYTVVHIYKGLDDDTATDSEEYGKEGFPIPCVGDTVTIYSLEDKEGNYTLKDAREKFSGVVDHIDHLFEQRYNRANAGDIHVVHFVEIFLKP